MDPLLLQRRARLAAAWDLRDDVVLIGAGEPIGLPGGADQTYPFVSHAEYFWLTDRETPGGVLAFDPAAGWTDFVPAVTEAERVWEGRTDAPGTPLPELAGWLAQRRGRRVVSLGVPLTGIAPEPARTDELRTVMMHARRPKDALELGRLRAAAAATARGFAVGVATMRAGVTERQVQVELEHGFFQGGGDGTAYGTIVGAGAHAGVLHFTPGPAVLAPGDAVLIDAGATVMRYCGDVTRTYRVAGGDAGFFRDLYTLVLAVEEHAIARCVKGAEWRDLHFAAATEIADGLVRIGILRGDAATLVERDTAALFFPHGLGHLVGLGVRDASGYLPGRARSTRPGLSMLRTDLPLEPGYVITVEPGIYFIPALLRDPARRATHRDAVAWDRVDGLLGFGGIRVEDDVHVTDGTPENLTVAIPKQLEDALLP